jgi:hypothetical protein
VIVAAVVVALALLPDPDAAHVPLAMAVVAAVVVTGVLRWRRRRAS